MKELEELNSAIDRLFRTVKRVDPRLGRVLREQDNLVKGLRAFVLELPASERGIFKNQVIPRIEASFYRDDRDGDFRMLQERAKEFDGFLSRLDRGLRDSGLVMGIQRAFELTIAAMKEVRFQSR